MYVFVSVYLRCLYIIYFVEKYTLFYVQDADIFDSRFLWFLPVACRIHLCNTSPSIRINDFLSFCVIFLRSALGSVGYFSCFFLVRCSRHPIARFNSLFLFSSLYFKWFVRKIICTSVVVHAHSYSLEYYK